jgi:hypothetical protein
MRNERRLFLLSLVVFLTLVLVLVYGTPEAQKHQSTYYIVMINS